MSAWRSKYHRPQHVYSACRWIKGYCTGNSSTTTEKLLSKVRSESREVAKLIQQPCPGKAVSAGLLLDSPLQARLTSSRARGLGCRSASEKAERESPPILSKVLPTQYLPADQALRGKQCFELLILAITEMNPPNMRSERSQTQQIRHSLWMDLTAGKPQRQTDIRMCPQGWEGN